MANGPGPADDGYFNDLSRQPVQKTDSASPGDRAGADHGDADELPKTKRIACVICRRRKLKCDGNKPKCATCARLGHNCAYDEVRKKSGPKRGYVKELEARLAQVEAQVTASDTKRPTATTSQSPPVPQTGTATEQNENLQTAPINGNPLTMNNAMQYSMAEVAQASAPNDPLSMPTFASNTNEELFNMPDMNLGMDNSFSWEMISLGLEEPLPTQETIDELTRIYFDKVHPSMPMIHKYRFRASMNLSPQARPPICLRYIMWALAASITDNYMHLQDIFYKRARKYIENDEMSGLAGENFVTIAHTQTWVLICTYEFKNMYFPRAWMSVGRGARLALMLGLNRVDGIGLDVKQCLPPPRDWTEREERRRTFWMAYCVDRYASIGTGWPLTIDERDIRSNLPASDENYEAGVFQKTPPLNEAMGHEQIANLSSFAGVVYVSHFFGRNLTHLHRPEQNEGEDNLQGQFWKRHRNLDNILLNTSLSLPSHLRLPAGVRDANTVFLNFAIQAATICLHQAAIFKAEKNQLPQSVIDQSKTRCILAASEIATVMRLTSHLDVTGMNPFMAFCLYVATRVFVQYLRKIPNDAEVRGSLEFLLTAMTAMKRKNPLTESFMVQLKLDIEGSGLDITLHNPDFSSTSSSLSISMKLAKDCISPDGMAQSGEARYPAYLYVSPRPSEQDASSDSRSSKPTTEDPYFAQQPNEGSTASVRSESPRQTRYALGNIQLQAMESDATQGPFNFNPQTNRPAASLYGLLSKTNWIESFTDDLVTGTNTTANDGMTANQLDVDMTAGSGPPNEISQSSSNSTGITPQSSASHHSTANSNYSTPQVEDDFHLKQLPSRPSPRPLNEMYTVPAPRGDEYFTVNQPGYNAQNAMGNNVSEEAFKIPSNWNVNGGSGMTPSYSGITPDAGWEQMMQDAGMVWEGNRSGMTPR